MIYVTKSNRGNEYAEVFFTKFGWSLAFTMAKKGDAYESLSLLFQRDGVAPKMIVDGSKENTLGVFKSKVAEDGCHLRQRKSKSSWKMAAEGGIRELKIGSGRNTTKMKSPKVL